MSNSVIVYFSKDGNTRLGANILNEHLHGKIVELKEAKKGNFIQSIFKKGSKLTGQPWNEIKSASQVVLMFPIWASNGVPAINTFIQNADFSGKDVSIITFQQFENLKGSDIVHKYYSDIVIRNNGNVKKADETIIRNQIDKVTIIS